MSNKYLLNSFAPITTLLQVFSYSCRNSPTPPTGIILLLLKEFFYSSSRNFPTLLRILLLLILQEVFYSSTRISFSHSANSSTPPEFYYSFYRNSSTPHPGILYSSSMSRSSNDSLMKLIHGVFFLLLVTSVFSSFTINSRTLTNASIR